MLVNASGDVEGFDGEEGTVAEGGVEWNEEAEYEERIEQIDPGS